MRKTDAEWHDVLCVQTNSNVDDPNTGSGEMTFTTGLRRKCGTPFGTEIPECSLNTQKIADRCDVKLEMGHCLPS